MFLHVSVTLFTGCGLHPGGWVSSRGLHPGVCIGGGGGQTPHQILWDTVNAGAVRILLECILV